MTNKEGIEGTRGGGKTFSGFLSFPCLPYSQWLVVPIRLA
ncbi:hypothetical protein WCP94_000843 [Bilophila wadsworthia]